MTVSGCSLHKHITKQFNIVCVLQHSQAMTHTSMQVLMLQKTKNGICEVEVPKYCIQELLKSL